MVKRILENYPNRIHALRTARGWSQGELGRRCDPPAKASKIGKLELGEQQLTEQWMRRLAGAFGIAPAELLNTATPRPADLAESDAAPYDARDGLVLAEQLYPGRRHTFVMRIATDAMLLAGLRPGDFLVVDPDLEPSCGSAVVVQHYDPDHASAETLVREYQPPFALPRSPSASHLPVRLDDPNVQLRGVITARWSMPARDNAA